MDGVNIKTKTHASVTGHVLRLIPLGAGHSRAPAETGRTSKRCSTRRLQAMCCGWSLAPDTGASRAGRHFAEAVLGAPKAARIRGNGVGIQVRWASLGFVGPKSFENYEKHFSHGEHSGHRGVQMAALAKLAGTVRPRSVHFGGERHSQRIPEIHKVSQRFTGFPKTFLKNSQLCA